MAEAEQVAEESPEKPLEGSRGLRREEEPEALASVREDLQAFLQRRG
jgi:hypothetical protein